MAREIQVIPARRELTNRASGVEKKIRLAPYCRVSTDEEDQLMSFENQRLYYLDYVISHPQYELVRIYADEGITGTNTRKRDEFNQMIADCEAGKIDMIITKSISRFARNTADFLTYSRKLRELGIGILFEKENINTIDSTGELLVTILSSLAQDESRNISENTSWGIRARFKQGKMHLNANRFLGYDKGKDGQLVINPEQAVIVKRIFHEFLDEGYSADAIAARLIRDKVPGALGKVNWCNTTIYGILGNEKYKGDALLQKFVNLDYLTGRSVKNNGAVEQYYVKGSHEAIIPAERWELVQLELQRRDAFRRKHNLRSFGRYTETQPFANKIFCGECGILFNRKTGYRLAGDIKSWVCADRFKKEGRPGCVTNIILRESDLYRGFITAWNTMLRHRDDCCGYWQNRMKSSDPLTAFFAKRFIELMEDAQPLRKIDNAIVRKTLEHVVVQKTGLLVFYFLDGSRIEIPIHK